ncbi:putative terminase large subunit [Brucella phage EF4]|uniref:Putative terminase large subunit n=1 Tax=Brucella phage EF4 TaxID=2706778 RepID=A0A6C0X282_9CAUD|nr:putative terminase large subunit [Brucella phage EF4]
MKLSPIVRELGFTGSPLPEAQWLKLREIINSTPGVDTSKRLHLPPGDSLLSQLRKGEGETSIRLPEMGGEVRKGSLLLPSLQPRARVVQGQEKVRRVREPDGKEDAQVLRHMPSSSKEVAPCDSSANLPRLPDLQQDFQSGLAWQEGGGTLPPIAAEHVRT